MAGDLKSEHIQMVYEDVKANEDVIAIPNDKEGDSKVEEKDDEQNGADIHKRDDAKVEEKDDKQNGADIHKQDDAKVEGKDGEQNGANIRKHDDAKVEEKDGEQNGDDIHEQDDAKVEENDGEQNGADIHKQDDAKVEEKDGEQNGADIPKQDEPETDHKKLDVEEDDEDHLAGERRKEENLSLSIGCSDLKETEKMALEELRSKVEEAILMNSFFKKKQQEQPKEDQEENKSEEDVGEAKAKGKEAVDEESRDGNKENGDQGLSLWGVPLLPSKGDKGTDVVLLKFLRARDFKVSDALEMLSNTLQWRKDNKIDSILEENLGSDYDSMASINGVDRRGHPVCYNVYGVFGNEDMYNKTFGMQESREKFLRWRLQLMERQIQVLDFRRPELGRSSLLQINDLKDTPGPSRKDLRLATRQAVALLQDNYPEFVARNIFINVPFWYYAFNALLSPFFTQRTKSKFVFARANRVTESLLKYIAGEEIPVKYGGLKRENDPDFTTEDGVSEITVKAGSTEVIEIPAPEAGNSLVWDLTVIGWEVNYREEFVPSAESSYTIIVKKERRIGWQEGSIRNSFKNNEPGKIVLTVENGQFRRKRVLYRFKSKYA